MLATPGKFSLNVLERRYADLARERQTFEARWRELAAFIMPMAPRWVADEHNKGDRSKNKIVDGVATRALRIAKSGLLQGMASPARPWFEMATPYDALNRSDDAARWLEASRDAMLDVFSRSNFYTALGNLFEDEMTFATSPMFIMDDDERVMRFEVVPVGSYCIAQNTRGRVDVFARELTMSARQAVSAFGRDVLPKMIEDAVFSVDQPEITLTVRHLIEPNPDYRSGGIGVDGMRYREVYWVHQKDTATNSLSNSPSQWGGPSVDGSRDGVLQVGGYYEAPFVVARWDKNDADTYGTICPSIDALGDIKQLQAEKKAYSEAQALEMQPPTIGGPGLKNQLIDRSPAGHTIDPDMTGSGTGARRLNQTTYPFGESRQSMQQLREAIDEAFMKPLFLMLLSDSRAQPPTAEEIRFREREKVSILGPIHARHSDDVFDPLIDRAFGIMLRRSEADWAMGRDGLLPIPPDELRGVPLRAVYVSEVAQMLRSAGLMSVERHVGFASELEAVLPGALDSVDVDALMAEHAEALGVPRTVRRSRQDIDAMRQARAAAQRAQQAEEALPGVAKAARDLSETKVGDQSALEALTQQ